MITLEQHIRKQISHYSVRILKLEHQIRRIKRFVKFGLVKRKVKLREREIKRCRDKINHYKSIL